MICLGQWMESAYLESTFLLPILTISSLKMVLSAKDDGSKGKHPWGGDIKVAEERAECREFRQLIPKAL